MHHVSMMIECIEIWTDNSNDKPFIRLTFRAREKYVFQNIAKNDDFRYKLQQNKEYDI